MGEAVQAVLAAVRVQEERYVQLVNVYQAMGGGWVDIANSQAPQPHGMAARRFPLF